MKLKHMLTTAALLAVAGAGFGCGAAAASTPRHAAAASTPQLVQICRQTPCKDLQILEVFDGYGNPGFTVGEVGGVGVLGDNLTLSGKTKTEGFHHFVALSEESPASYDHRFGLPVTCTPPGIWVEPGGIWSCTAGRWTRTIRL